MVKITSRFELVSEYNTVTLILNTNVILHYYLHIACIQLVHRAMVNFNFIDRDIYLSMI
jgi:hypothetical protein